MKIREFYLNEETDSLYIEFSTEEDGDDYYRILDLSYDDTTFYSPTIIEDISDICDELIIEIIIEYLKHNESPEEISL
jgi:hypothetical protein